ncbi:MAG: MoxR family ATPase [Clostridia bacterium]|jgi:MoxR-like ATPase|nr:MoxR family ATPase [Clostridia bacterium]
MATEFTQFKGTKDYIAATELKNSVNIAINLGRPLLIKGEPGTGKTMLAKSIAEDLGLNLIIWSVKSTTKAKEGLYMYDTVQRLYDSQFGDRDVSNISNYIKLGRLGEAFTSEQTSVLLIDEIDKADLEFPNDLLWELDIMNFYIPETKETVSARNRPIVIITSNAEKELPDAFLRRCIFHYIDFPDAVMMEEIIKVHHPHLEKTIMEKAIQAFYNLRNISGLQKKPSTSELLDWVQALVIGGAKPHQIVHDVPFMGVLIKKNEDIDKVKRQLDIQAGRKPASTGSSFGF